MRGDRLPHPVHVPCVDTLLTQQRGSKIRALHLEPHVALSEVADPQVVHDDRRKWQITVVGGIVQGATVLWSAWCTCAGTTPSLTRGRHGLNVQLVTDPAGRRLWLSPALPGRAHDLMAARTHRIIRIIRICERQGIPVLADRAYMGGGPWVTTPLRRPPGRDLTPTQRTVNRALAAARTPVERGVARLKSWRSLRRSRRSPNRMSSVAAAVLTPERQL